MKPFGQACTLLAWLPLLRVAAARGSADGSGCPCLGLGDASFLQRSAAGRPRDCTCVNGMKTYPTTPRDELKAMGKVALRHHLEKCERETEDLETNGEVTLANNKAMVDKVQAKLDKQKAQLNEQKAEDKKALEEERKKYKELKSAVDKQEKELADVKGSQYMKAYTKWFELSKQAAAKVGEMAACECSPKKASAMLETRLSPDEQDMYDNIKKVEDCENKRLKLQTELKNSQVNSGAKMSASSDAMDALDIRAQDHARVAAMFSKKPLIDALEGRKKLLDGALTSEKDRIKQLEEKSAKLDENIKELGSELKACGC